MATLLRIDSSARMNDSISRQFADEVETAWKNNHQNGKIIRRDLIEQSIPHIANQTIAGFYAETLSEELLTATQLSDTLIGELLQADALLISVPMYNFSIPSAFKAWVDQIVRIHKTFGVNESGGLEGLVPDKPCYLVLAKGAVYQDTDFQAFDFLEPYLKSLFQFLGIQNIEIFALEGTTMNPEHLQACLDTNRAKLKAYSF